MSPSSDDRSGENQRADSGEEIDISSSSRPQAGPPVSGFLNSEVSLNPLEQTSERSQTYNRNEDLVLDYQRAATSNHSKPVVHQVMYLSREVPIHIEEFETEPVIKTFELSKGKDRIIQICTIVNSVVGSDGKAKYDMQPDNEGRPKVQSIEEVLMTIYAPELVNAIRQLVLYYPSEAISNAASAGYIPVRKPYHVLQLYRDDLAKLRESYNAAPSEHDRATPNASKYAQIEDNTQSQKATSLVSGTQEEGTVDLRDFDIYAGMQPLPQLTCDEKLYRQLILLEDILDKEHKQEIDNEKLCHKAGTANFDMLWYLFKAGSFVYAKINNKWTGAVVYIPQNIQIPNSKYKRNGAWMIYCWYLGFDGKTVRRIKEEILITAYNGARDITSLPVYPIGFGKDPGLLGRLVKRGKTYYEMLVAQHTQMHYRGEVLRGTRSVYNGRVIVDPRTSSMGGSGPSGQSHLYGEKDFMTLLDDTRGDGILGKKYLWDGFLDIDPQEKPTLTNRHYFLFPQGIRGFALQRRKWETLDVEYLTACPNNLDELDKLILGTEQKSIIMSLSQSAQAGKSKEVNRSSMIQGVQFKDGRREGRIFLLHGPSGVGKTFTAECVAISTGRPLLSLTCAELGTDETGIEAKLEQYFTLARIWDAVIVIDEAEVYVEGRGQDFKRGNLVAAFLRALETFRNEYHGGIIFLTTNRIFKIDPAVRSRVHIPIYYPPLDKQDRKRIYSQCVEDLRTQGFDMPASSSFIEAMEEMKWNGREIRNSLQTIAQLAEYGHPVAESLQPNQSIKIAEAHIQPVLNQLEGFKAYFDDNSFSESFMAEQKGERSDDWSSKGLKGVNARKLKSILEEKERARAECAEKCKKLDAQVQELTL